jgi:hypothetical protein
VISRSPESVRGCCQRGLECPPNSETIREQEHSGLEMVAVVDGGMKKNNVWYPFPSRLIRLAKQDDHTVIAIKYLFALLPIGTLRLTQPPPPPPPPLQITSVLGMG